VIDELKSRTAQPHSLSSARYSHYPIILKFGEFEVRARPYKGMAEEADSQSTHWDVILLIESYYDTPIILRKTLPLICFGRWAIGSKKVISSKRQKCYKILFL